MTISTHYLKILQSFRCETPDKVMFVDRNGSRQTTCREFWTLVLKTAQTIRRHQTLRRSGFIAIYLSDSMEYFAADCAIWMSGNAAVHMGLSFPKERVDYILQHCEADLVIDEAFMEEAAACPEESLSEDIAPRSDDQPCVMFYTSGSTGNPKGVLHSDHGLLFSLDRIARGCDPTPYRSFASTTSCYFVSVTTAMCFLRVGLEIHVLANEVKLNVDLLADYIDAHRIEFAHISPSLLRLFHNTSKHLKLVRATGERLVGGYSEDYQVLNAFGQTETAGPCLFKIIEKNYDNTPIGRPAPGVEVGLFDEEGREVPQGEVGELCFKSGLVPPVYYKDPERTARLMRGGVLHTGDLMRQLPNGDYLYLQRKDWMVKINGQRVEPGEVEAVLCHVEGVKDAIVKGFTTNDLTRQYLVGYYIEQAGAGLTPEHLSAELSKTLPPYMVPQYFVRMERFPLNANHKIDRKSLLPPDLSAMRAPYAAPETDTQKVLCEAFATVLRTSGIGLDDDFFHLGGDSIRTIQLQQTFNQARQDKDAPVLSSNLVYAARTPRRIAEELDREEVFTFVEQDDYPLSEEQKILVERYLAQPTAAGGWLPFVVKLDDSIDMERMAETLVRVLENHDAFAIRLRKNERGEIRQYRSAELVSVLAETLDEAGFQTALKEAVAPSDIFESPLYYMRLVSAPSGKHLIMTTHHLIFDGASRVVFLRHLAMAYEGRPLPTEDWTPFHVAQAEAQFRQSPRYGEAIDWFQSQLSTVPTSVFPKPDSSDPSGVSRTRFFPLGIPASAFEEAVKDAGVTANIYATTAFARLLGEYASCDKVAFFIAYDARTDYRSDHTVGMLACGLPLIARGGTALPFREHVQEVNDYAAKAMAYFRAGLHRRCEGRSYAEFLYQGERPAFEVGGKPAVNSLNPYLKPNQTLRFFLHLNILPNPKTGEKELVAMAGYSTSEYSDDYLIGMMKRFGELLKNEN